MSAGVWWTFGLAGAVLGLAPAYIAERKGRDWFWWWVSGALAFPVALPLAFAVDPLLGKRWRRCPHCCEFARHEARVCPYCTRDLPAAA
jgi:integral membrane sensor domain MASE1